METGPSVLIVGAGAAGIAAATRLLERGFRELTILEAHNRIGGRIHSVRRGTNVLDYGAQWVHGKENNFVYDLADAHGLIEVETHMENELYYTSQGAAVPKETSDRMMETLNALLEANADALKKFPGSLGAFYDKVFHEAVRTGSFTGIDRHTCHQLYDFFTRYHNTYNATDTLHEISGAGLLEFEDHQDEYLINWKNRGFHTILDLLMKKLPEQTGASIPVEDYVKLNHTVSSIKWSAATTTPGARSVVTVTCTNGATFTASHLIVTVSLGVLKEMHTAWFDPPLPDPKRNAIEGLYIGTIDKLFLEFAEPFWPAGWHGFGLLWEPEDLLELQTTGRQWLEGVCSFFVPDRTDRLLVGWIYGRDARTMESLPEAQVIDGLMFLLRRFLPVSGQFRLQPSTRPTWFSRSRWYSDPHFRGSYTSRSLKSDAMKATAADLATPLTGLECSRPIVQFAGEASHPEFYSTVQGAIASGWREADRLVDLYGTVMPPLKKGKL